MYVQLLDLKPGDRVKLHDGSVVEIVSNPEDGIWVETRSADATEDTETTTMTHCQEIAEVV